MLVSIAVKKELYAISIFIGGKNVNNITSRIIDESIYSDKYKRLLFAFTEALKIVRSYINISDSNDDEVIFEFSNSTVIGWFENGFSANMYADDFADVLDFINRIPMKYSFVFTKKPKAYMYLSDLAVKKEEVLGIDSLLKGDD